MHWAAHRDGGWEVSTKKTFREKLAEAKNMPRVQTLTGGMKKRYGPGTILIPAPSEVAALMRKVPKGKLLTVLQIREHLAREHGATMACPIVTGIHARVVAGAAGEEEEEGKVRIVPYWRTLKSGGELNEKYPGGLSAQRSRLEDEGHEVVFRGKRTRVNDYERFLVKLG